MRVEANSSLISRSLQPVQAASAAQVEIPDSLQSEDRNPELRGIFSSVKEKFLNACNWVKNLVCSIFNFISCGYFSQVSPSGELEQVSPPDELEQKKSGLEKLIEEYDEEFTEADAKLKNSWVYRLARKR